MQKMVGLLAIVAGLLTGCMLGPDYQRPAVPVPAEYRSAEPPAPGREAVSLACRVRLRPVLMTSLATLFGLLPMALKLGTGSEAYATLARAIIGGLGVSVVLTVFIVPAAYLWVYGGRRPAENREA